MTNNYFQQFCSMYDQAMSICSTAITSIQIERSRHYIVVPYKYEKAIARIKAIQAQFTSAYRMATACPAIINAEMIEESSKFFKAGEDAAIEIQYNIYYK